VHFAEIEVDRKTLREVQAARKRMASGLYGLCLDCGDEIPRERFWRSPRPSAAPPARQRPKPRIVPDERGRASRGAGISIRLHHHLHPGRRLPVGVGLARADVPQALSMVRWSTCADSDRASPASARVCVEEAVRFEVFSMSNSFIAIRCRPCCARRLVVPLTKINPPPPPGRTL